jgi:hypothetical protein
MSTVQGEALSPSPSRLSVAPSRLAVGRWVAARLLGGAVRLSSGVGVRGWEEWRNRW